MTDLHSGQETFATAEEPTPTEAKPALDPATLDEDQQIALTILEEICAASGLDARPVAHSVHPPYMDVEIVGEDVAATFGRYGQSIDALQLLANLIVSRRTRTDVRLLLDAADYRNRRASSLQMRAFTLAKEVKARNEEAELEPLPAHERRIIHAALADDPDVMTYSEGDEPDRRVVISPRR